MNITMETTRDELIQELESLTADFEALKSELSKADRRARRYDAARRERETDLRKVRAHRDRLLDERDTLAGRLDSMKEKANFFAARLPKVEACIRWAAQQGYSMGQDSADEYCVGKGLVFVSDQPYYNLSKFTTPEAVEAAAKAMADRRHAAKS